MIITRIYFTCRFNDLKEYSSKSDVTTILVGTKCHSTDREVSIERARTFAEHRGVKYIEVCAEEGTNVVEVFELLADLIIEKLTIQPRTIAADAIQSATISQNSTEHRKGKSRCACQLL
jgi:hypothetical protein